MSNIMEQFDILKDMFLRLNGENLRLQNLVDSLTEQLENQNVDEKVVRFLDLIQSDIERTESLILHEGDHRIQIVEAFRQIRPK